MLILPCDLKWRCVHHMFGKSCLMIAIVNVASKSASKSAKRV